MMKKKPCGCGKVSTKNTSVPIEQKKEEPKLFSESPLKTINSGIFRGLSMVQSYAISLISRGISSKKVEPMTKQLRTISCFGNINDGGELPPCSHLMKSETEGKYYCGACGCGDKPSTWLNGKDSEYSKLDYPSLSCPLTMPGFTNYSPSPPNEWQDPITRKKYIETMKVVDIKKVDITVNEIPLEVLEVIKKLQENTSQKIDDPPDA